MFLIASVENATETAVSTRFPASDWRSNRCSPRASSRIVEAMRTAHPLPSLPELVDSLAALRALPPRTALVLWRDNAATWRLGIPHDERSPLLQTVVEDAGSRDRTAANAAAWTLLLTRANWDRRGLAVLADVVAAAAVDAEALTPLFAAIAVEMPDDVAALFPAPAVAPCILALCGAAGTAAALRALRAADRAQRQAGGFAVLEQVEAGLAVDLDALRRAHAKEDDVELRALLGAALAAAPRCRQ
ncbi:MAG: hypothetical protein ACK53T_06650 [Planctomycetota bacterium]